MTRCKNYRQAPRAWNARGRLKSHFMHNSKELLYITLACIRLKSHFMHNSEELICYTCVHETQKNQRLKTGKRKSSKPSLTKPYGPHSLLFSSLPYACVCRVYSHVGRKEFPCPGNVWDSGKVETRFLALGMGFLQPRIRVFEWSVSYGQ